MFAYCNNNPINLLDSNGNDPVLFAAGGGAVAGALISLFFYAQTAGDSFSLGGALLAMTTGALAGALGGAAGMVTGDARVSCLVGAGIVSALMADCSGGSALVSGILGFLGALGGTYIDLDMFEGIALSFASFLSALGVGYPIEMASQSIQQDLYENQPPAPEPPTANQGAYNGPAQGSNGMGNKPVFTSAYGL